MANDKDTTITFKILHEKEKETKETVINVLKGNETEYKMISDGEEKYLNKKEYDEFIKYLKVKAN